jgi:hypothetical protein
MPRRLIVKKDEIYKRRGESWSFHYQMRETVKQISGGLDVQRILLTIGSCVPAPELDITAALIVTPKIDQGINNALEHLRWTWKQKDMMCVWYWNKNNWMDFVRAFQSLPEVEEDYYYLYSKKTDEGKLVPMSSKPKLGSKRAVENPVDKKGTTMPEKVQLPEFERVEIRRW